jgi:hypothetical protein
MADGGGEMKRVWQCDSCCGISINMPWKCPVCGKETCDSCFDRFCICKKCSEGKTDEELKTLSNWEEDKE